MTAEETYDRLSRAGRRRERLLREEALIRGVADRIDELIRNDPERPADIARRLGVSRSRLRHIQDGENLTLRSLSRIADALGLRVEISFSKEDT